MTAEVLWPERENLYDLMRLRATIGPAAFLHEKQNDPIDPESCEWGPEYFDYPGFWFEKWPMQGVMATALALDPSKGKDAKLGDYSAYVKAALTVEKLIYVDADLAIRPTPRMVEDGIDHIKAFQPQGFVVEINQYQELLAPEFLAAAAKANLVLPLYGITNTAPKEVRIRSVGPYLYQRRLRFKANSPGVLLGINQLRDFPIGEHDDFCDSLDMAIRLLLYLLGQTDQRDGPQLLRA